MALLLPQLDVLSQILARKPRPLRLLSLGYPDIVVASAHVERLFGREIAQQCRFRDDGAEIIAWHGMQGVVDRVIDSAHFFEILNVSFTAIDIMASRGVEQIVDLNQPMPETYTRAFDIVIDPGTIEHCCNIGQAMMNLANAVRQDGYVLHFTPMTMINHGFFNVNPTLFHDFYSQNGFKLEALVGVGRQGAFQVPATARMQNAPSEASLLIVAHRTSLITLKWPTQSKYLANPSLKAEVRR